MIHVAVRVSPRNKVDLLILRLYKSFEIINIRTSKKGDNLQRKISRVQYIIADISSDIQFKYKYIMVIISHSFMKQCEYSYLSAHHQDVIEYLVQQILYSYT